MNAALSWLFDSANWSGPDGIPHRVSEHLLYVGITLAITAVIALPLGAWIGHTGKARWLVTAANSFRAIPTLGLLFAVSMLISPLIKSSLAFVIPSIVVLVLLAIPPMLSGIYAGIESVDPATRDAAKGMGMTGRQVLWQVEIPGAMPLILSGFRSATLQVIATATIAASVSLGGLGRYLIDGLAAREYGTMAGGAIVVALLALLVDGVLALVQKFAVSPGISGRRARVPSSGPDDGPDAADSAQRHPPTPEPDPAGIAAGSQTERD